eukprot:gene16355-19458_t
MTSSGQSGYEKDTEIKKIHNLPVPASTSSNPLATPFIVLVYNEPEDQAFKINELVEFVGIVSRFIPETPVATSPTLEDVIMNPFVEEESNSIPESLVPRFHAISWRTIDPYQHPTSTSLPFSKTASTTSVSTTSHFSIPQLRTDLLNLLSRYTGGDALSAEYLLFTSGLSLGSFSLNLVAPEKESMLKDFPEKIEKILSMLVTRSHMFGMTIDNLNDGDIIPYKDYDRNRIVSGLFQLPRNTHLIIDETKLKEGQLHSQGIRSLQAFKDLVLFQKVEYDFQYHPVEIQTDIQLLILSSGINSLVPGFSQVPMCPTSSIPNSFDIDEYLLDRLRLYICTAMNGSLQASSESVTKAIEDDFVLSRQNDPNTPQEIFHYWLTLTRLLTLSFGETQISLETWKYMKQMESNRLARQPKKQ